VVKGVMSMDARTRLISVLIAPLLLLIGAVANPGAEAADFRVMVHPGSEKFAPQELTIKVGDRVTWVNEDRRTDYFVTSSGPMTRRTTVATDDLVMNVVLHPGTVYTRSFKEPGTYHYFCAGHVDMWGAVIVKENLIVNE